MVGVSIIVPVFNGQKTIAEALNSVMLQTVSDFEVIVINDGSVDKTAEIVQEFVQRDPIRFRLHTTDNQGPSSARNLGLAQAKGEFIAFLDADDLWHPRKLENQLHSLENHIDAVAVISNYQIRSGLDSPAERKQKFDWNMKSLEDWSLLLGMSPCFFSTVMIRANVFESCGNFNADMKNVEDVEFAFRLIEVGLVVNTGQFDVTYRNHAKQNHRNTETMIQGYQIFLGTVQPNQVSFRRNLKATISLFEMQNAVRERKLLASISAGIKSVSASPFQWFRILGAQRKRKFSLR
jgi:glycosyltransferase involved in cell wall biosynthesis